MGCHHFHDTLNAVVVTADVPRIVMGMWILGSCVERFDSLGYISIELSIIVCHGRQFHYHAVLIFQHIAFYYQVVVVDIEN